MTRPKPTHSRYVWRFWVKNITHDWKMDAYDGQTYDPTKPVQLLDSASLQWGFESDMMPGQFEPSTGTFMVGAPSVAELPDLFIGDQLYIWLYRVDPFGSTLEYYFELPCRITDVVVQADPAAKYPVVARVYVSDALADLQNRFYPGEAADSWEYWPWGPAERLIDLAAKCRFNIALPVIWNYNRTQVPPDLLPTMAEIDPRGRSALDLLRTAMATFPYPADASNPSHGHTWVVRPRWGAPESGWHNTYRNDPADPITYVLYPLADRIEYDNSVYAELIRTGTGPVEYAVMDNAGWRADDLCIPACAVTSPTELRRDRRNQITDLSIQTGGIGDPIRTLNYSAIAAPVRVEQALDGQTYMPDLPLSDTWSGNIARNLVNVWLPWLGGGAAWSLPDLDIHTDLLTDDELDNLVTRFKPTAPTGTDPLHAPTLTLTGLDAAIRPGGHTFMGAITRAMFSISRGRLTITVRPSPVVLNMSGQMTNQSSWAQVAALGTAPGPKFNQMPGISWADLRHSGVI